MMVSLSSVLTTIAVVWIIIIIVLCACNDKEDCENIAMGIVIIVTILSTAIVLYRIGSFIFSLTGG